MSKNRIETVDLDISGCEGLEDLLLSSNMLQQLPDSIGEKSFCFYTWLRDKAGRRTAIKLQRDWTHLVLGQSIKTVLNVRKKKKINPWLGGLDYSDLYFSRNQMKILLIWSKLEWKYKSGYISSIKLLKKISYNSAIPVMALNEEIVQPIHFLFWLYYIYRISELFRAQNFWKVSVGPWLCTADPLGFVQEHCRSLLSSVASSTWAPRHTSSWNMELWTLPYFN